MKFAAGKARLAWALLVSVAVDICVGLVIV
jgi:hypothetical protein